MRGLGGRGRRCGIRLRAVRIEKLARIFPDDAVRRQSMLALEQLHRLFRRRAELSIDAAGQIAQRLQALLQLPDGFPLRAGTQHRHGRGQRRVNRDLHDVAVPRNGRRRAALLHLHIAIEPDFAHGEHDDRDRQHRERNHGNQPLCRHSSAGFLLHACPLPFFFPDHSIRYFGRLCKRGAENGGKWFMMYQYYIFIINIFNILFSLCLHIVQTFVLHYTHIVFLNNCIVAFQFPERANPIERRDANPFRAAVSGNSITS